MQKVHGDGDSPFSRVPADLSSPGQSSMGKGFVDGNSVSPFGFKIEEVAHESSERSIVSPITLIGQEDDIIELRQPSP